MLFKGKRCDKNHVYLTKLIFEKEKTYFNWTIAHRTVWSVGVDIVCIVYMYGN